jgi:PIN domain nuclease of toxin-antitoxin system
LKLLLDTHMWIWWLTSSSPLKAKERAALDQAAENGRLCLSAISMWEAQLLHFKARLELPMTFAQWLERATDPRMLAVLPLDRDVVIALCDLPTSFHGDPADRLIVATARAHDLPLATRDRVIRRSRTVALWKA